MGQKFSRRNLIVGAAASAAVLTSAAKATGTGTIHNVTIKAFNFEPVHLKVRIGDTIRWTNHDLAPHSATAEEFGWDTNELAKNESGEITVTEGMETSYFCAFHPHMKGTFGVS